MLVIFDSSKVADVAEIVVLTLLAVVSKILYRLGQTNITPITFEDVVLFVFFLRTGQDLGRIFGIVAKSKRSQEWDF